MDSMREKKKMCGGTARDKNFDYCYFSAKNQERKAFILYNLLFVASKTRSYILALCWYLNEGNFHAPEDINILLGYALTSNL